MSKLETITIDTPSGSNTMQIGSTNTATINLGVSGDTINVPAGVTIANAGTATGFGEDNKPVWDIKEGGATTVGNNTNTTIEYDVVIYDTASAMNTSTYKYVIPSAGYYFVRGSIAIDWSDSGANERADFSIRKNSGSIVREMRVYSGDAISGASNLEASGVFLFAQNDAVYMSLFKTDGGNKTTDVYQGYSQFQGFKVASS